MAGYYRSDGWVKLVTGQAVPGAQIYVLEQPATYVAPITPPRTTPVPFVPSPQVLIYSDEGLTPLAQPVLTDNFGHYDFYVLPGLYTLAVFFGGILQQAYIDQSIGGFGSSGTNQILLSTNGSPNFSQTALNLVQGANVVLFSDNLGNTTISASGSGSGVTLETNSVANPDQALLNLVSGPNVNVSYTGAGTVSFSAPNSTPSPDVARTAIWEAVTSSTIPLAVGDDITSADGGADQIWDAPDSGDGMFFDMEVIGPSFGNSFRQYIGVPFIYPGRTTIVRGVAEFNYNIVAAQGNYSIGASSCGSGNINFLATGDGIYIACLKVAGDPAANWQLVTVKSGVPTLTDSGVPIVPGQRYTFVLTTNGTTATLSIGGVVVAITSSNLPVAPLGIWWAAQGNAGGGGGTCICRFEYLYAQNATPPNP